MLPLLYIVGERVTAHISCIKSSMYVYSPSDIFVSAIQLGEFAEFIFCQKPMKLGISLFVLTVTHCIDIVLTLAFVLAMISYIK